MKKLRSSVCLPLLLMLFVSGCGSIRLGGQLRRMEAVPLFKNGDTLVLQSNECMFAVTKDCKAVSVNQLPVALTEAVRVDEKGFWQIGDFSGANILYPIVKKERPRFKVILIDPGHGGKDSGAVAANGTKEKDLNLRLSLLTAEELRKRGFTVYLTRQDDRFLSLDERPALISKFKADLFISIHHNSAANKNAAGHEVYLFSAKDEKQAVLLRNSAYTAFRIEEELRKVVLPARGVKLASFKVQRLAQTPSILIEAGFLSNAKEAEKLSSEVRQKQFAKAVATALAQ